MQQVGVNNHRIETPVLHNEYVDTTYTTYAAGRLLQHKMRVNLCACSLLLQPQAMQHDLEKEALLLPVHLSY